MNDIYFHESELVEMSCSHDTAKIRLNKVSCKDGSTFDIEFLFEDLVCVLVDSELCDKVNMLFSSGNVLNANYVGDMFFLIVEWFNYETHKPIVHSYRFIGKNTLSEIG